MDNARNNFSNVVEAYAKYRRDYPEKAYEMIYDFCPDRESEVLDLGCGTGFVANHLAGHYKKIVGVDKSEEMMEVGRKNAPSNVSFVKANAEELPFEDGAFDLITCAAAYHWFDYQRTGKEMYRVLKSDGKVCVFWKYVPGSFTGYLPEFAFNNLKKFVPNPPYSNNESIGDHTFTSVGFSKVKTQEFNFEEVYTKDQAIGLIQSNSTYNLMDENQKKEYDELNRKDIDAHLVNGKYVFKAIMELWFIEK